MLSNEFSSLFISFWYFPSFSLFQFVFFYFSALSSYFFLLVLSFLQWFLLVTGFETARVLPLRFFQFFPIFFQYFLVYLKLFAFLYYYGPISLHSKLIFVHYTMYLLRRISVKKNLSSRIALKKMETKIWSMCKIENENKDFYEKYMQNVKKVCNTERALNRHYDNKGKILQQRKEKYLHCKG